MYNFAINPCQISGGKWLESDYSSTSLSPSGQCIAFDDTGWRHQMETFSTLLAICAGNSPVTGEIPTQKPVTRSFHVFFDLRLRVPGGYFPNVSRALQDILSKFVHCRNRPTYENLETLYVCPKFQLEILTINVISDIVTLCIFARSFLRGTNELQWLTR